MENKEILKEIEKKIAICKENINAKNSEEAKIIILDIEKLIGQYSPESDIEKRIIKNRISELEGLKATGIIDHDKKKQRNQNAFYGKVPMIDLIDCEKWIKDNKDDWQKEMDRIDNFVKKFPFENNSIQIPNLRSYAIGTGRGSFCLEVEIGTPGNIGQKSSLAYHIYWSTEENAFIVRDGVHGRMTSLKGAESIYSDLKENLDNILKLAYTNEINLIEKTRQNLKLPISNVLQKILFIYFPEKFMGYYSKAYIYKIAAMLGIGKTLDVFQTNHEIAQKVKQEIKNPLFSEKDKTVGFTIYLWRKWDNYLKKVVD